jgi:hypothetical protein
MKTRINLTEDNYFRIKNLSKYLNISMTDTIKLLFQHFYENSSKQLKFNSSVKYQKTNQKWKSFHITLNESEYEQLIYHRFITKMSVSLILAISSNKYIRKVKKSFAILKMDNYPLTITPVFIFYIVKDANGYEHRVRNTIPILLG